jgi:hypothetical protein
MVILGVYFEQVPSPYDPPNANEFYQALGKAITAWGRLEGNFNHLFITALNVAPDPRVGTRFYIQRARLAEKWTLAFETTQPLAPLLDRANSILSDMEELAKYRDHYVHGLWGHFVSASPLTRRVEKIKPRNEVPDGLWHSWIDVSLENLETFLRETNRLNTELSSFADILIHLRGEISPAKEGEDGEGV